MALAKKKSKKTSGKKKTNIKAKGKGKKKGAKPKAYEVGQRVAFVGYAEQPEEPLFTPGEALQIVDVERDENENQILSCIKFVDAEAYEEDAESVDGEQLTTNEVKRGKGKIIKVEKPIEVKDVGELTKIMKKGDLVETAKQLYEDAQKNFFYLGGILAHIFHEKLFREKDYGGYTDEKTGWDEFCEDNFGFKGRKGRYLADVYMTYSQLPDFDVSQLNEIGWSKAAEVARYATADNVEELVDLAEKTPIAELKSTLKEEYTTAGATASGRQATRKSTKLKKIKFNFELWEDQAEGVSMILEMAQKSLGHNNLSDTFEHIVTEWAAGALSDSQVKKAERAVRSRVKALKKEGIDLSVKEAA